jgi:hypothetical protein
MRRRIAPAGKRIGERVVAGTNVLDRYTPVEACFANALLERTPRAVIHCIACRHRARLLARDPHQFGVDGDWLEPVVPAIARDH